PPTTTWSTYRVLVVMPGSLRLRQAGRVGLRLLDRLGLQAPALEHLEVGAVLDGVVGRGRDRRRGLRALRGGGGDLRRVRPAAVERAGDPEVLRGGRRLEGERRVGADVRLDAPGLQREEDVGELLVVLGALDRVEAVLLVEAVPLEHDLLLVRAR